MEYSLVPKELSNRLCPHRGLGEENTLSAIKEGLKNKPFLLEFDIQLYNKELHLGHPPKINKYELLIDALELFRDQETIPKIDIKVDSVNFRDAIIKLIEVLDNEQSQKFLINISGFNLSPSNAIEAEVFLIDNSDENVLLNIDLERYIGLQENILDSHIGALKNRIFSVSPRIGSDLEGVINFCRKYEIRNLHFWCDNKDIYESSYLIQLLHKGNENKLNVYFDINIDCIK